MIFALVVSVCACITKSHNPVIKKVKGEYVVVLPKVMREDLQEYDASFTTWNQNDYIPSLLKYYKFSTKQIPSAVIGDLNGDEILDVVLQGHNKNNDLLICVLSNGKNFKVAEIRKYLRLTDPKKKWLGVMGHKEYGLWSYLTFTPSGKVGSPIEEKPLDLKTDAFEFSRYEKASTLYYYKDGRFLEYSTGD